MAFISSLTQTVEVIFDDDAEITGECGGVVEVEDDELFLLEENKRRIN